MTAQLNSEAFSRKLMSNLVRMLKERVIVFLTNANVCFYLNMDDFKSNFPSQGQLESLSLNKFFLFK